MSCMKRKTLHYLDVMLVGMDGFLHNWKKNTDKNLSYEHNHQEDRNLGNFVRVFISMHIYITGFAYLERQDVYFLKDP